MATYGQFCPVSKAADLLCQRWTLLVVRELLAGTSRFGDLQRGLPGCPPATLSKRLKELAAAGVLQRIDRNGDVSYRLTEAGAELYPIVEGFGRWGQRWVRSTYGPEELDVEMLLWDIRRFLDPDGLGVDRAVIELDVGAPAEPRRHFWIVVEPGSVDLCMIDPGQPVDVVMDADLRALTQVWMGDLPVGEAIADRRIVLRGPNALTRRIPSWLGRHPILAPIAPATPRAGLGLPDLPSD